MNNIANISVVVPIFNAEKTLRKCVDSILMQSIHNYKIYLINDGSTDNTKYILDEYKKKPNIVVINKKNEGVAATRNYALRIIDTPFVTFVDADDYVEEKYLEHLSLAFNKNNVDMAVTGIIRDIGKERQFKRLKKEIVTSKIMINEVLEEDGPGGYLWNKMFNMKVIKKYNISFTSNINMAEDLLFCIRYLLHIKTVSVLANCDYHYVQSNDGLSSKASIFNTNSNYKKAYLDYISALQKIREIIPSKWKSNTMAISARLCRTSCDFMRTMMLNHSKDASLYSKIRLVAIRNERMALKSNIINKKQKTYLKLVIYFPNCAYFIDKIRFRRSFI